MKPEVSGDGGGGGVTDYLDTLVLRGLRKMNYVQPLIPPCFSSSYSPLRARHPVGRSGLSGIGENPIEDTRSEDELDFLDTTHRMEESKTQIGTRHSRKISPSFVSERAGKDSEPVQYDRPTEQESLLQKETMSQWTPPSDIEEKPDMVAGTLPGSSNQVNRPPILQGDMPSDRHMIKDETPRDHPGEIVSTISGPGAGQKSQPANIPIVPAGQPQSTTGENHVPHTPDEYPGSIRSRSGLPHQENTSFLTPGIKPPVQVSVAPQFSAISHSRLPPPSIHVTIGRIEVKAVSSPQKQERDLAPARVMTLHDYLNRRKGRLS